nr:hypothetical protein [Dyadobacter bucti]
MNLDRYALTAGTYSTIFEFTSEGPKGYISKIVAFQNIGPGIYNLAFGDKNDLTGDFDDQATSDNGDSEKVLATVVQALYKFFDAYPCNRLRRWQHKSPDKIVQNGYNPISQ